MNRLIPRVAVGVAAGVALYVGLSIWADAGRVAEALAAFRWRMAALGCLLAAGNYLIRYGRWHYYLRVLRVPVGAADSLAVFLSGFALTVTPGKLGEAVKAFLLRQSHGVPLARTAPIVIAERVTDPLAELAIAVVGRLPGLRRLAPRLGEFHRSTATLLRPVPLLLATLFSTAS